MRNLKVKILMWISWRLPPSIALWCFIRVYALSGDCGPDYKKHYDLFVKKYKLEGDF